MPSPSDIRRNKCYEILAGLERSLMENLVRNVDIETDKFLTPEQQYRGLVRLRKDMEQSEWELEDVNNEDLLQYLDLGDFCSLFNRHRSNFRTAKQSDIPAAANLIQERGLSKIRNRVMHPVRPLDPEDLSILLSASEDLPVAAPSLIWEPLAESVGLAKNTDHILSVAIPLHWTEEPAILHNLPVAEFGDTGFVGRDKEIRALKNLLGSDHNVVTIVGAGGIGKTALALRVCHDVLDDSESGFDRIVWVSLKTQYFTTDGIREITDAVDTTSALVRHLSASPDSSEVAGTEPGWEVVLEQMRASRTLLVVDNLETLGKEIRDLAIGVPRGSKLLLTSRVGLGEIEIRYEMPSLSPLDASRLFRTLATAYNYADLQRFDEELIKKYSDRLHYNPLLIKWFVQAVGMGATPESVLSQKSMGQALRFCWQNVYEGLTPLARRIVSTIMAARQGLSQTEIQEILNAEHIPLNEAIRELHRCNIIERRFDGDGREVHQIGGLVLGYLSRHAPPDQSIVTNTREKIRKWRHEQDRNSVQRHSYRYDRKAVHVETSDEKVSAPHLSNAINAILSQRPKLAWRSLNRARELTPTWWQVHQVHALLLELEERPIYEIEQAFEDSIKYKDCDINRFHYADYLLRIHENVRALEQVDKALQHEDSYEVSLRSVRGVIYMRRGNLLGALEEFEFSYLHEDTNVPTRIKRIRGTQFAGALRGHTEKQISLGNFEDAQHSGIKGIRVASETARDFGWDPKLAEVGVSLLSEVLKLPKISQSEEVQISHFAGQWDSDARFIGACRDFRKTLELFEKNGELSSVVPRAYTVAKSSDRTQRFTGVIARVLGSFGFIKTEALGDVYMNRSSLVYSNEWSDIRIGDRVTFSVIRYVKGPHAIWLEFER